MIALLLATLLQGAPASIATAAPSTKAVVQADKRGVVCRKETVVGSTIKKKICSRPLDDRAEAEDAQALPAARDAAAGAPK